MKFHTLIAGITFYKINILFINTLNDIILTSARKAFFVKTSKGEQRRNQKHEKNEKEL